MTSARTGWILVAGLAGAIGCQEASPPPDLGTAAVDVEPYIGQQGRLVLGFQDPDVRRFVLPTSVVAPSVNEKGGLVASGMEEEAFAGMVFKGVTRSGSIDMRVAEVIAPVGDQGTWEYVIEQKVGTAWKPACAQPVPVVPPPSQLPATAIAMEGTWNEYGLLVVAEDAITFACRSGVAAKCRAWGYRVDKDPPEVTQTGHASEATGYDMALACARMARADYCGHGIPGTLEGTPIHLRDAFGGPVPHDPHVPGFEFEAAWKSVAGGQGRRVELTPALCLSKLRWSTLPLGGRCPLELPDPRIDQKGTFCEDMTEEELESAGALTYSGSSYIDAGLYSHRDAATGAALTTTALVPDSAGEPPEWLITPPAGVPFPAAGQTVRLEATVFSTNLPDVVPRDGLVRLITYACAGGDLVTTSAPPAGCTPIIDEGWVYAPNTPGRAVLRRWRSPAGARSFTTAAPATSMIEDGWTLAEVVGGAVRGAMDVNIRWSQRGPSFVYALDVQTSTGEWVACYSSLLLGNATSVKYTGWCPTAHRLVPPAEIAALRVSVNRPSFPPKPVVRAYDGASADVHVDIPGGSPTALTVAWPGEVVGSRHTVGLVTSSGPIAGCAGVEVVADGDSTVLTGHCPTSGADVPLASVTAVQVCRVAPGGGEAVCATAARQPGSSRVEVDLP